MCDYIDRKVAVYWFSLYFHTGESVEPDVILEDIRSLPSSDVAPVVHGKWIFNDDLWEFRCTNCKRSIGNIEKYKYCPHCGARMDAESK